ncbi:MAG TPA: hypothetical protein VG737_01915, partial [Cyclobacteriaceae bacterium]|nr:hypothetical protein [Cyclobacteriaceae bacterium]
MKTARISSVIGVPLGKAILIATAIFFALVVFSCETEDTVPGVTADDASKSSTDALADSYYDDADDVVDSQLESDDAGLSGGKVNTDQRLACADITRQGDATSGTLRIDFGTGCTDP